jgi:hypothetical protein
MKRIVSCIAAAGFVVVIVFASAFAQQSRSTASADSGDFIEGNLKFHRVGGFLQVTDTVKNQSAGTVIFPPGGAPVFAPMPGYDIQAAYEKHMNSGAAAATAQAATKPDTPATPPSQPSPATAPATGFDAATKTVTLSDGRSVTFVDNDNLKVQFPGAAPRTYDLHFHKASAGGFMQGVAGSQQGRVGGSLGGGGVTISIQIQAGTPSRQIFDTAKGVVYDNSGFEQAKTVTAAVREAAGIVKNSQQPDLAKYNVVKSLLSNNLGM